MMQTIRLLAQGESLSRVGGRFQPGGYDFHVNGLVWLAVILAGIGLVVWLLARHFGQDRPGVSNPRRLFRELCQVHEITWNDRRLLWQVTRRQQMPHPARLFLEPEILETALGQPALEPQHARLRALQEQLFA